jgi:3-methyl-2-oxobutanoate hydroxymethyltransferase
VAARVTVPAVRSRKVTAGAAPLVMVTAYDAPTARLADAGDVDLLLVGDSLAMVVLGYEDTLQITVADMAHHVGAVARAKPQPLIVADLVHHTAAVGRTAPRALVVADLPWMSYHVSVEDTVRNAARLIRAGATAVKLEGGTKRLPMVRALVDAEIPVMGHLGLTPQSVHALGGFKVQGRRPEAADARVEDALGLVDAGVFALVLEAVPAAVARRVTEAVPVPTIGIGAGPACDGQVLVLHDLLGLEDRVLPRFVRRYASLRADGTEAVAAFAADVRSGAFPGPEETYEPEERLGAEAHGLPA